MRAGIQDLAVFVGLALLGAGLYLVAGLGWSLLVLGALLVIGGVVGSLRGGG